MDECQQCGCPFLTLMRNAATGQWAAQCDNCGEVYVLADGDDES